MLNMADLIPALLNDPTNIQTLLTEYETDLDQLYVYAITNNDTRFLSVIDIAPINLVSDTLIDLMCEQLKTAVLIHALRDLGGPNNERFIEASSVHIDIDTYEFCIMARATSLMDNRSSDPENIRSIMRDVSMLNQYV